MCAKQTILVFVIGYILCITLVPCDILQKYWVNSIFNTIYLILVGIKSIDIYLLFKYKMPQPKDINAVQKEPSLK